MRRPNVRAVAELRAAVMADTAAGAGGRPGRAFALCLDLGLNLTKRKGVAL